MEKVSQSSRPDASWRASRLAIPGANPRPMIPTETAFAAESCRAARSGSREKLSARSDQPVTSRMQTAGPATPTYSDHPVTPCSPETHIQHPVDRRASVKGLQEHALN